MKRNATDNELVEVINDVINAIRVMLRDLNCQCALEMTDNEFIVEIEKNQSIGIDFARLFAKKRTLVLVNSTITMRTLPNSWDMIGMMRLEQVPDVLLS